MSKVADRNTSVFRGEWVLSIDIEMGNGKGIGIVRRAATAIENALTDTYSHTRTNANSLAHTQTVPQSIQHKHISLLAHTYLLTHSHVPTHPKHVINYTQTLHRNTNKHKQSITHKHSFTRT